METFPTPFTRSLSERASAERTHFRKFVAVRIGSEERVAEFLVQQLVPALRLGGGDEGALVTAWFLKAQRLALTNYLASPLTPAERAQAWLACGSTAPKEEVKAVRACVAYAIETLPESLRAVVRQVEFGGASLWTAGFQLELNAHAVWARLRNGRAECRGRLIQFLHDCAAEAGQPAADQIAAIA